MNAVEKAKKLNEVAKDFNLTLKEKQDYVDTLSEQDMRSILKEVMGVWVSKSE